MNAKVGVQVGDLTRGCDGGLRVLDYLAGGDLEIIGDESAVGRPPPSVGIAERSDGGPCN